jgi:hypothetical protein
MDAGAPPTAPGRPIVIGWREPVALPRWRIGRLKTKVDTGARTSSLHVRGVEDVGAGRVRVEAVVSVRRVGGRVLFRRVPLECEIARETVIRSSTGKTQQRYVVRTLARMGDLEREIELTLVCRRRMRCRLLLGRTALEGFVVDPMRGRVLTPYAGARKAGT